MKNKILVIEDNKQVRENIEEILELSDYDVVGASNGIDGVRAVLSESPDLILCDIMMPELDGFGVLSILEKNPETNHIPFIFLTAKADNKDIREGMNLGADDYLTKPFDHQELLKIIDIRLKKSFGTDTRKRKKTKKTIDLDKGKNELKCLVEHKETVHYNQRDTIFREGEIPRRLFYIEKGKIKTFRTNDFGKELITGIFKDKDYLGFEALIADKPYRDSAVAIEASVVRMIPKEDFYQLIASSPDFTNCLILKLAENIKEKDAQLLQLAYHSIRKRVASALVSLHKKYTEVGEDRIDILRDDLASMVGTAKESISRALTDFKQSHLIEIDQAGAIKIVDERGLQSL